MARTFQLPDPGEGIHEAEVVTVHVSPGERVEESDVLLEVETDKAVVEVPSPFTGRVEEVLVSTGDEVRVGDDVLRWEPEEGEGDGEEVGDEEGGEGTRGDLPAEGGEEAGPGSAAEADAAQGGESEEGEGPGGREEEPEEAEEAEAAAEAPGGKEGGASREPGREPGSGDGADRPVPAAPATRRLARELGVALERVEGSGPGGRVTREDVESAAAADDEAPREEGTAAGEEGGSGSTAAGDRGGGEPGEEESTRAGRDASADEEDEGAGREERAAGPPSEEPARPEERPPGAVSAPRPDYGDPGAWGPVRREPLRSVRRTTARRMADAWHRIPHVTHVEHADVTDLEGFRREHAEALDEAELTLSVFLLKALVAVLKEFPRFNARLDEGAEEIVLLDYHHLGVAVDSDRGLLVPVIRDVDGKSLAELARELGELVAAVRDRQVTREQMRGGSFTLTNPGPLGGDLLTPIINPPQVAILGAGRAALRPAVVEGGDGPRLEPRRVLPLCLSFDHRVNDGADAARFCTRLVEILEDPDVFVRHL